MQWTEINDRLSGTVTIVDLAGHITLCEDKPLLDKVKQLLQQRQLRILFNLAGVPYIDSPGLGEIVSSYTTVVRRGGTLKLCRVSRRLRALLETTRLSGVIEVFDSEEEAISSFQSA
jgi:anti-sigma B factor antagonist